MKLRHTGALIVGMLMAAASASAQTGGTGSASGETLQATVVESKTPAAGATPGTTVCTNGANKRRVEMMAGEGGKGCSVHYKKETEQPGHDQVIYTANNDTTFCATKAQAFVDKLSGWGWSCAAQ